MSKRRVNRTQVAAAVAAVLPILALAASFLDITSAEVEVDDEIKAELKTAAKISELIGRG